ncbi:hypothetical protein P7C70_g6191, partial [Phenoliferia sp. Uapishka_3]
MTGILGEGSLLEIPRQHSDDGFAMSEMNGTKSSQASERSSRPRATVSAAALLGKVGPMMVLLVVVFWINLSHLYGSFYDQGNHTHRVKVPVVDFDGGEFGQALIASASALNGKKGYPTYFVLESNTTSPEELQRDVFQGKYWTALYANEGASERWEATTNGSSRGVYDPENVWSYITLTARYFAFYEGNFYATDLAVLGQAAAIFSSTVAGPALASSSLLSNSTVQSAFTSPAESTEVFAAGRDFLMSNKALINTVGIVMPILMQFFFTMGFNGISNGMHLYAAFDTNHHIIFRVLAATVWPLISSLCVAGWTFAYKGDDYPLPAHAFVAFWIVTWVLCVISIDLIDVITAYIPIGFVPPIFLTVILWSVTASLVPPELVSRCVDVRGNSAGTRKGGYYSHEYPDTDHSARRSYVARIEWSMAPAATLRVTVASADLTLAERYFGLLLSPHRNNVCFTFPREGPGREVWGNYDILASASPYLKLLLGSGFIESHRTKDRSLQKSVAKRAPLSHEDSDYDEVFPKLPESTSKSETCTHPHYLIEITESSYVTYTAVLCWIYSGYIRWAPLSSSFPDNIQRAMKISTLRQKHPNLPTPASPKSVFRLSHLLELSELQKLSLQAIEAQLTADNVLEELFSETSGSFDEVMETSINFLISRREEIRSRTNWDDILTRVDEAPWGAKIALKLIKILAKPSGNSPASAKDTCTFAHYEVEIPQCPFVTYEAVLCWIYTGFIEWAPLSSSFSGDDDRAKALRKMKQKHPARPTPTSPKSVYRLAHLLDLPELQKLALQAIKKQLTVNNILDELMSETSGTFDDVTELLVGFAISNREELKTSSKFETMSERVETVAWGGKVAWKLAKSGL